MISGEEFETAVTFVASTADSQTRTFRVESELPNEQSSVKDGLTGEMTIFTDSQKAISFQLLPFFWQIMVMLLWQLCEQCN